MPTVVIPGKTSREQIRRDAIGVLSEVGSASLFSTSAAGTSQRVEGMLLGLRAGDVVTGVVLRTAVAAAGTLPTTARFGIADSTGKILALSGNDNALALWAVNAANLHPFTAQFTVPSDGGYFACFVVNGTWGTTQPTIVKITGNGLGAVGSGTVPSFMWTGQTDLPAVNSSLTITAASGTGYYMAFY